MCISQFYVIGGFNIKNKTDVEIVNKWDVPSVLQFLVSNNHVDLACADVTQRLMFPPRMTQSFRGGRGQGKKVGMKEKKENKKGK